ncbi:inorganic phosphate transporter, partial [Escherichia sp. TWPC-MK]
LLKKLRSDMLSTIEYAPVWIIMAVALALGIGTMIGWRRVAMTIGEKIGKRGMTYAQGMAAQMTAAVWRRGRFLHWLLCWLIRL